MIDKKIGLRIRSLREARGMTQEQFAEKAGLSVPYISMIERGVAFPRCAALIRILNSLSCSADDVFCDVLERPAEHRASLLSERLAQLPDGDRKRILDMVELMVLQAERDLPEKN